MADSHTVLNLMEKAWKMSLSKQKDVRHLVEKYRREFSSLERPLLRRLIRSENKIEKPSELKKLDRYLAKAFQNEVELSTKSTTEKPSRFNIWKYLRWKREYEDAEIDRQIREIQCKLSISHEKSEIYDKLPFEKGNDPLPVDVEAELERKWRKFYRLDSFRFTPYPDPME